MTKYLYAVALDTPAWAAAASTVGVVPSASSVRADSIIAARVRAFLPPIALSTTYPQEKRITFDHLR